MKTDVHPEYHEAKVTCACGNSFVAGSTLPNIQVEICSKCHPFFTGEMRFVDTMGRVERFRAKQAKASATPKKSRKTKSAQAKESKSLKEMLEQSQKSE